MPLLPSRDSNPSPDSTILHPISTSQPAFDDESLKQAQSYWVANTATRLPSPSERFVKAEFSRGAQRDTEAQRRRQRWIQVKNRRRRWLDLHPEYFQGSELESADPLLYDRLVRRFQSTSEREEEGKNKGFAGTIAASILRGEARIEETKMRQEKGLIARHPMDNKLEIPRDGSEEQNNSTIAKKSEDVDQVQDESDKVEQNLGIEDEIDGVWAPKKPESKEDAFGQWRQVMSGRFIDGKDVDFNYTGVDDSSEWDDHEEEERRRMDDWFDEEEPSWGTPGSGDEQVEKILTGETGVQDY